MERAIAEMEKIKKAEEIYSRRKNLEDEDKKPKNVYKFMFELLILITITIIVIAIQNQKYIFTKEFIDKVNSCNINLKNKIESVLIRVDRNKDIVKRDDNTKVEESEGISGEANNVSSAILVENELESETDILPQQEQQEQQELSQEEKDIIEIKEKYSIILPINGVKTSGFGERESTNSKVSKNHTGVDIAASLGTVINSATSGKVIEVSSSGNYGKHFRIQTGDLVVLYAHCSKIYVKEGQELTQGEPIAEVGATGNTTGPHLHFEIKLYDRLINPEKILEI